LLDGINKDITYLKGVGEKRAKCYEKLGIKTIFDLLYHFPRGYVDYSNPVSIADCVLNESNIISGVISKKMRVQFLRNGLSIYKAVLTDGESDITIVIFNSEYLFTQLKEGESYILNGKVTGTDMRKEISSPIILPKNSSNVIQPIYPLTDGLTQSLVQNTIKNALKILDEKIFEPLPKWILGENELCSLQYALQNIHLPQDMCELEIAKNRLIFDELLILQLGMLMLRGRNRSQAGFKMEKFPMEEFYLALPFELTNAQKSAISDCISDLCGEFPMNRLVQGDVGSGKTAVAAGCAYFAYKNRCQTALMAPTEILATQHYNTLTDFLQPLGVKICLLTGSLTPKEKSTLKKEIANGEYSVIVGTHALVQKTTLFNNLGLVITDEQHRFGVNQRADLAEKGENPHKLVMSATPIPRTLALMIYGDLDISVLDELPKGRQPIETFAVTGKLRQRAFHFIKERLVEGRQAYIVCPMIDETENELQSVTAYAKKLIEGDFNGFSIGILHGKLASAQKEQIMAEFKAKKIDLLVSTTVIEVGVDVPNAVVMMVENSDRFGLSQLHQLRGRVGRGEFKSYCILVTDNVSDEAKARLKVLSKTNDGFKISEEDLKLRGPGDFFGSKQHGLPQLKIANMAQNLDVLKSAQKVAKKIIREDKALSLPENRGLNELVTSLFEKTGEGILN